MCDITQDTARACMPLSVMNSSWSDCPSTSRLMASVAGVVGTDSAGVYCKSSHVPVCEHDFAYRTGGHSRPSDGLWWVRQQCPLRRGRCLWPRERRAYIANGQLGRGREDRCVCTHQDVAGPCYGAPLLGQHAAADFPSERAVVHAFTTASDSGTSNPLSLLMALLADSSS